MNLGRAILALTVGALTAAGAAGAVEWSAFLEVGGRPRFVLTDSDDNAKSPWISVGQAFGGYELVGYDAERKVLTVRKAGQVTELALAGSHVTAGSSGVAVMLSPELIAAGITPGDLVIHDSGPVRITLILGSIEQPTKRRYINLHFDTGTDRAGIQFGADGPQALSRSFVPETVREFVSDQDIALINAHLATVRAKWLPQGGR